jgi:hypothetical protein
MTDEPHENYIHAVVAALDTTFDVKSFGHWSEPPLRGSILLGASDDWDDYQHEFASAQWHETDGWIVEYGGWTTPLELPVVAAPGSVLAALCFVLGPSPRAAVKVFHDADECTAEALLQYAEVVL